MGNIYCPLTARIAGYALAFAVFVPQARIVFQRQGWPEAVVIIDDIPPQWRRSIPSPTPNGTNSTDSGPN